ncbi:hypothetical protein [Glycomyces sp. NPDC021274]|uniref:hypothetical protein n=1 Tax=Glycomyces sp. NPDC021274 TaxID=3155120 RepID=UPI0033C11FA8
MITEAGRFYLEHGTHPEAAGASAAAGRTPRQRTRPADDASSGASPRYGPPALKRPASAGERHCDAVELVERLRAERIVDLLSLSEAEVDRWRKTIDYAKRHGLVPEGHRIECNHPAASTMTVRLVAATHPTAALKRAAQLPPVPVPGRLDQPHPVIARLRDDSERMEMPSEVRHRGLCILQALAEAAVERGWDVTDAPGDRGSTLSEKQQVRLAREGVVRIGINGFRYTVTVDQKSPQAPDPAKASRLKIALPQSHTDLQSTWTDAKTVLLEQRLPEVIEALSHRVAADQERTAAEAHARAAQQVAGAAEAARDRERAVEVFLAQELDRRARELERWRLLTAYCDQLEAHLDAADPQAAQTESARAWLAWARAHTAKANPFSELPGMPEVPDDLTRVKGAKDSGDAIPDVSAARTPMEPRGPKVWDTGRRFHSNG